MSTITRNLQLFWRAERVLAEARIKLTTRKIILGVVAGIACLFAWGMLNVAGYFALEPAVGKAWAAFIVGAVDIVLAALLVLVAQGLQPGPEEDMVREVRDMALGEMAAEVEDVQKKLVQFREDVEGLGSSISDFVQRPFESFAPSVIGPAVMTIIKLLKSKKN